MLRQLDSSDPQYRFDKNRELQFIFIYKIFDHKQIDRNHYQIISIDRTEAILQTLAFHLYHNVAQKRK
jgi:hypothetical protein